MRKEQFFQVSPTQAELQATRRTRSMHSRSLSPIKCTIFAKEWAKTGTPFGTSSRRPSTADWPSHLDPILDCVEGLGEMPAKRQFGAGRVAEELGVKYAIMDAMQADNANLRGMLTGKPSDVVTNDD